MCFRTLRHRSPANILCCKIGVFLRKSKSFPLFVRLPPPAEDSSRAVETQTPCHVRGGRRAGGGVERGCLCAELLSGAGPPPAGYAGRLFERFDVDGDHRARPEARPQAVFDVDGQCMRVGNAHRAVDAHVHLDGDRGADAARAQVVRRADLGVGRDDRENLLLDIRGQRLFEQFAQPRADQVQCDLEDEDRNEQRRDRVGDAPLLAEEVGAADAGEGAQRREGVAAVVPGVGYDAGLSIRRPTRTV